MLQSHLRPIQTRSSLWMERMSLPAGHYCRTAFIKHRSVGIWEQSSLVFRVETGAGQSPPDNAADGCGAEETDMGCYGPDEHVAGQTTRPFVFQISRQSPPHVVRQ